MELQSMIDQLLALAGSALTIIGSYLLFILTKYIETKKKAVESSENISKQDFYIVKGLDLIQSAVQATNQTMVDALKVRSADGSLTPEEATEAFNETRNAVIKNLSNEAREAIKTVYGDLDMFIDMQIQSFVATEKREKSKIAASLPNPSNLDLSDGFFEEDDVTE